MPIGSEAGGGGPVGGGEVAEAAGEEEAAFGILDHGSGALCSPCMIEAGLNRNLIPLERGKGAGESELGDLADEAVGLILGGGAAEVVGAEVLVEGAVAQHVVGGGENGGGDGADRLLGAAPVAQALELGAEIAVPLVAGLLR